MPPASDTIFEGFFVKEGGSFKSWKRRWFTLTPSLLLYSQSNKDGSWTKSITISSISSIKGFEECTDTRFPARKGAEDKCFGIATPKRRYHIASESVDHAQKLKCALALLLLSAGTMDDMDILKSAQMVLKIVQSAPSIGVFLKDIINKFNLTGFSNCRTSNKDCRDACEAVVMEIFGDEDDPQVQDTTEEAGEHHQQQGEKEPQQSVEEGPPAPMDEPPMPKMVQLDEAADIQTETETETDPVAVAVEAKDNDAMVLGHGRSAGNGDDVSSLIQDKAHAETLIDEAWTSLQKRIDETPQSVPVTDERPVRQTIRLFVSSTFADMYSERELLVRQVIPKLRPFCSERNLDLIVCDLRWGVPKESTSEDVIGTCLGELYNCRKLNTNPFFINLLGERYGWVPRTEDVPATMREEFEWIDNLSITHMEMVNGALVDNNPNAAFFLRDPKSLAKLPDEHISHFIDQDVYSSTALKRLKSELGDRVGDRVFHYSCEYDKLVNDGKAIPTFSNYDGFVEQVLNFLEDRIEKQFPIARAQQQLTVELYKNLMDDEMNRLATDVIGRDDEVAQILTYCRKKFTEKAHFFRAEMTAAQGLEALFALAATKAKEQGMKVFFIKDLEDIEVSKVWQQWLADEFDGATLKTYEQKAEESEEPVVFFIPNGNNSRFLAMVCDQYSGLNTETVSIGNLHYVIGDDRNAQYFSIERGHIYSTERAETDPALNLQLTPLTDEEKRAIVRHSLGKYNKVLDDEQLNLFVSNPGADSVEWIACACEELRVHGVFETVTQKVQSLPENINDLHRMVLKRVKEEDSDAKLWECLCYLAAAQLYLQEMEIRNLLGTKEINEDGSTTWIPLPSASWQVIRHRLSPVLHIRNLTSVSLHSPEVKQMVIDLIKEDVFSTVSREAEDVQMCINHIGEDAFVLEEAYHTIFDYYSTDQSIPAFRKSYFIAIAALNLKSKEIGSYLLKKVPTHALPFHVTRNLTLLCRCKDKMMDNFLPQPERQCISCAHKISNGLSHINKCAACGNRVPFINPHLGKDLEGHFGVTPAYRCRRHAGPFAFMKSAPGLKCYHCDANIMKQSSYPVMLCPQCSSHGQVQCTQIEDH